MYVCLSQAFLGARRSRAELRAEILRAERERSEVTPGLAMTLCPSVRRSVGPPSPASVGRSVCLSVNLSVNVSVSRFVRQSVFYHPMTALARFDTE